MLFWNAYIVLFFWRLPCSPVQLRAALNAVGHTNHWGKTTIKSKYKKRDVVLFAILHWFLVVYFFSFYDNT